MLRVIQEVRPAWVLGENVTGIVNMELDNVLSDLEGEGYETQTFNIPACAVDAKHQRKRIWIVAHSEQSGTRDKTGETMLQGRERTKIRTSTLRQKNGATGSSGINTTSEDVAHTDIKGLSEWAAKKRFQQQPPICSMPGRNNNGTWYPESDVGRVAYGVPRRVDRLKRLGNAIVPQVAYQIMKDIDQCFYPREERGE